jgi:hypothetical protein
MGWLPHYQVNYVILAIVAFTYAFLSGSHRIPLKVQCVVFTQILIYLLYSIGYADSSYLTRIFLVLITYCLLATQYNKDKSKEFVRLYNFWLLAQAISGTIGVILVFAGRLQPLFIFDEMDLRPGYCFGFFATNAYVDGLIRNAGFYDEPGALACWGVYALLLNKLFIKSKLMEVLLIISLLSTLSMAYFIQLFVYLILFYHTKLKKLLPLGVIIVGGLYYLASYNEKMNSAIWGRFVYNAQTGSFSGDNRSDLFAACRAIFLDHPITGIGAKNLLRPEIGHKYGFVGANFYTTLASDGIIGLIVAYLPLIFLFILGRKNKEYGYAAIILFIGFLQRPYDSTQLLFPLSVYTMLMYAYIQSRDDFRPLKLRNS